MDREAFGIAKKWLIAFIALLLLASGAVWFWYKSQPHYRPLKKYESRTKPVEITGEVVDAWCYASQTMGPGRGIGHLACAISCVGGGVTPGIVEDKTEILYIAAKYNGYQGCNELLLPFIGKKVVVRGWAVDLGGSRLLKIGSVRLTEAEAAESARQSELEKSQESEKSQKSGTKQQSKPSVRNLEPSEKSQ